MSERILLKEEIVENEAYQEFYKKFAEEDYIKKTSGEFSKEFEKITLERIEVQEKWLRLKVESAKARRDFESKTDPKFYELESISPTFNKSVWDAEAELERHLKKYDKK